MPLALLLALAVLAPSGSVTYDDRALVASPGWSRGGGVSVSHQPGATLTSPVATTSGGSLTVRAGPRRGVLSVRVDGIEVRRVRTRAARVRTRTVAFVGSGSVEVVVRRPGRHGVHVDALTLTPAAPPPPPPGPARVVVAEVMADPAAVTDDVGEWFELANVGGSAAVLDGCTVSTSSSRVALPALTVEPGGAVVVARTRDSPGVDAAATFSFSLANAGGSLAVACAGVVLDSAPWPTAVAGVAWQRAPDGSWCSASTPYGAGDLGTPGQANVGCGSP